MGSILTIILIISILTLVFKYYRRWKKVSKEFAGINLPGPKPLPIFGNSLALLKSYRCPTAVYCRWAREFGPMYKIRIGTQIGIVVSDLGSVEEVLKKHGWEFNQRPRGTILSMILGNKGIVTSDGNVWKDHRMFLVRKFKDLRLNRADGHGVVVAEAVESIEIMKEKAVVLTEKREKMVSCVPYYDPSDDIGVGLFNTMWTYFGKHEKSKFGRESILNFLREFPRQMKVAEIGGAWNYSVLMQLGWVMWNNPLKLLMGQLRQKAAIKYEMVSMKNVLELKDGSDGGGDEKEWNLLEDYLRELEKAERKFKSFSETQLQVLLSDIIAAGVDTTHNAIRWALIFLGKKEECQRKLRKEIADALAVKSVAEVTSYTYRAEMPYLCGVILETLRMRPIIHTFCHATDEEVVLTTRSSGSDESNGRSSEVRVPAGAWVMVNLWGVHHDEKVWEKPDEFKPERFLDDQGKFSKDAASLCIPFSVGIRNCPGEQLARVELYTYLVALFKEFKVRIHPQFEDVPLESETGVSLGAPRIGFQFCYSPLTSK